MRTIVFALAALTTAAAVAFACQTDKDCKSDEECAEAKSGRMVCFKKEPEEKKEKNNGSKKAVWSCGHSKDGKCGKEWVNCTVPPAPPIPCKMNADCCYLPES